jgi:hypothetical protein
VVNRGAINAVEVERAVDAEQGSPGLTSIGGLAKLGLVAVVSQHLGRASSLQVDVTVLIYRYDS